MNLSRCTLFISSIVLPAHLCLPHPLAAQNPTPRPTFANERSDLNQDNVVDAEDLLILMQDWGKATGPGHSLPIEMVTLPPGSFLMGNSGLERESQFPRDLEFPRHQVTIGYSFEMGVFEITNSQYAEVLNWANAQEYLQDAVGQSFEGGEVYHAGEGIIDTTRIITHIAFADGQFTPVPRNGEPMANHPVNGVTWHGAVAFCNWLSEMEGRVPAYDLSTWTLTNSQNGGYRLPSEAEWEYACRGSAENPNRYGVFSFGDDPGLDLSRCDYSGILDLNMVWCGNNDGWTRSVGRNLSNDFGLHDMHGNAFEWCEDWWHEDYIGAPTDGSAWLTNPHYLVRVFRGGSWRSPPQSCRSASRGTLAPTTRFSGMGFRVVRFANP